MPNAPAPPEVPWPEYPRPQFGRPRWACLNGEWEFAFDDAGRGPDRPVVGRAPPRSACPRRGGSPSPSPIRAACSGIGDTSVHEVVWYARDFDHSPGLGRR